MTEDRTGCRRILGQWSWGRQTFPSVHSVGGTEGAGHTIKALNKNDCTGYVLWDNVIWLQSISALAQYYLLYCWPSEGGNVDDEEHLTPVVTERNQVSIQGLSREIIDWFIRHACTLACIWDCSQSRVSIHPAIPLAHLIHWNITHGSAIVRHDWLHCSPGQRWAGRVVICSTHVSQEEGQLTWWQLIGFGKLNIQNKLIWVILAACFPL